jgi:hypothetical protein
LAHDDLEAENQEALSDANLLSVIETRAVMQQLKQLTLASAGRLTANGLVGCSYEDVWPPDTFASSEQHQNGMATGQQQQAWEAWATGSMGDPAAGALEASLYQQQQQSHQQWGQQQLVQYGQAPMLGGAPVFNAGHGQGAAVWMQQGQQEAAGMAADAVGGFEDGMATGQQQQAWEAWATGSMGDPAAGALEASLYQQQQQSHQQWGQQQLLQYGQALMPGGAPFFNAGHGQEAAVWMQQGQQEAAGMAADAVGGFEDGMATGQQQQAWEAWAMGSMGDPAAGALQASLHQQQQQSHQQCGQQQLLQQLQQYGQAPMMRGAHVFNAGPGQGAADELAQGNNYHQVVLSNTAFLTSDGPILLSKQNNNGTIPMPSHPDAAERPSPGPGHLPLSLGCYHVPQSLLISTAVCVPNNPMSLTRVGLGSPLGCAMASNGSAITLPRTAARSKAGEGAQVVKFTSNHHYLD